MLLVSNSLEFYRIAPSGRAAEEAASAKSAGKSAKKEGATDVEEWRAELYARLFRGGHRADPRTVAVTPDGSLLLSCSRDSLKIWNRCALQHTSILYFDYSKDPSVRFS